MKYHRGPIRCPRCDHQVQFDTEAGRLVSHCVRCERRDRGECVDCGFPRGDVGRRHRCDRCHLTHRRASYRAFELRHREERLKKDRAYYRRTLPYQHARHKKYREENRGRIKLSKRRGRLNGTWGYKTREGYLAAMRAQNEKRREHCREVARKRYYEIHPVRPDPRCRICGARVPWTPPGRPPVTCDLPPFEEAAISVPCMLLAGYLRPHGTQSRRAA